MNASTPAGVPATRRHRAAARPGSAATFLFRTLEFTCRADAVYACEAAIEALVAHADRNEPATRLVASFRDADDPGRYMITSVFDDELAARRHDESPFSERLRAAIRDGMADRPKLRHWIAGAGL